MRMSKKYAVRNIRLCTKDCLCLYVCPTGATDTENSNRAFKEDKKNHRLSRWILIVGGHIYIRPTLHRGGEATAADLRRHFHCAAQDFHWNARRDHADLGNAAR